MAKSRMNSRRGKGKKNDSDLGGFTIIEVVLVLAIAGLIFLMVFIALPALQRAQRDTQRRDDLARVSEAITQYQTNNNGRLPAKGSVDAISYEPDEEGPKMEGNYECKRSSTSVSDSAKCLIAGYLNSANATVNTFTDPDGVAYGLTITSIKEEGGEKSLNNADYNDHMIYVLTGARCDGEYAVATDNEYARQYAVIYKLEGSGTYCQDNQ